MGRKKKEEEVEEIEEVEGEAEDDYDYSTDNLEPEDSEGSIELGIEDKDPSIIKMQLDTDEVKMRIRGVLAGEYTNNQGKTVKVGERVMEENDIDRLMPTIHLYIDHHSFLSNMKESEIENFAIELWDQFLIFFSTVKLEERTRGLYMISIFNKLFAVMKRAQGGGERRSLSEKISVSEHRDMREAEPAQQQPRKRWGMW